MTPNEAINQTIAELTRRLSPILVVKSFWGGLVVVVDLMTLPELESYEVLVLAPQANGVHVADHGLVEPEALEGVALAVVARRLNALRAALASAVAALPVPIEAEAGPW